MSLSTVEIRIASANPSLVELQATGSPAIVQINMGPAGASGGSTNAWDYKAKTTATSGYPGNGFLLWNNATQTSATSIIVSHLTDDNTDIELFLSFFVINQKIFIQDRDDSSKNQVWRITGTPTVTGANTSTAYYTFPVTLVSSAGAAFTNNHSILFGQIVVATNAVTSATTTNFTSGQVLYANGSNVGSLSRSGIDTRTTFPNDDVTAATNLATADTLVRRGANGNALFSSSVDNVVTLDVESNGAYTSAFPSALRAVAGGSGGIGAIIFSDSNWGAAITSNNGTGAAINSNFGTYHADFGSGDDRSAIERVRGWIVWFYNSFTGRLKTADITANREWTLPNASGTVSLIANTETLTNKTLTSPSINSATIGTAATFNATTYTFGAGAAAALNTALGTSSVDSRISSLFTSSFQFAQDNFFGRWLTASGNNSFNWILVGTATNWSDSAFNASGFLGGVNLMVNNAAFFYYISSCAAASIANFNGVVYDQVFNINTSIASENIFIGIRNSASSTAEVGRRGLYYEAGVDTNWQLLHETSAGVKTKVDTGKAVTLNQIVRVTIKFVSATQTDMIIATSTSTTAVTVSATSGFSCTGSLGLGFWLQSTAANNRYILPMRSTVAWTTSTL